MESKKPRIYKFEDSQELYLPCEVEEHADFKRNVLTKWIRSKVPLLGFKSIEFESRHSSVLVFSKTFMILRDHRACFFLKRDDDKFLRTMVCATVTVT